MTSLILRALSRWYRWLEAYFDSRSKRRVGRGEKRVRFARGLAAVPDWMVKCASFYRLQRRFAATSWSRLYVPLQKGKIRLLRVLSHNGETAVCEVLTYPRWLAPPYDAVSYCWGENTETTAIVCNGFELQIRTSLFRALSYFTEGRGYAVRPLWIDAICLNQDDHDEKAHQVPNMGEIYASAARTLVWLGEDGDNSDVAMKYLKIVHDMLRVGGDAIWPKLKRKNHRICWESVQSLLDRPWFSRLWVLQEIVCSKSIWLLCGHKSINWTALTTINKPSQIVEHLKIETILRVFVSEGVRKGMQQGKQIFTPTLFSAAQFRQCLEPVDRVWALLGLLPKPIRKQIEADGAIYYTTAGKQSYWISYLAFMKTLFAYDELTFWKIIQQGQGYCKCLSLPSWCVDWNARQPSTSFDERTTYRAGRPDNMPGLATVSSMLSDDNSLSVAGFEVAIVQNITSTLARRDWALGENRDSQYFPTWFSECVLMAQQTLGESPQSRETLVKTIEAAKDHQEGETSEYWAGLFEIMSAYCALHLSAKNADAKLELFELTYSQAHPSIGRKLFRTTHGSIGLGPGNMEIGDKVCVFRGCGPLFILRRAGQAGFNTNTGCESKERGKLEDTFQLVGDAYINGRMNGEAFTASNRGPDRQFVLV